MTPLSGPILKAAEMRAAEAAVISSGTSVDTLMERAGAAIAEAVWRYGGGRETLILCGPGNNGGDGYVAARLLKARGIDVRVAALREPKSPPGIVARSSWDGPVDTLDAASPAPILVDALFGTGLARPLEPEITAPLNRLAKEARFIVAVDLPSGIDSDSGAALGAVRADVTVALGALKLAHLLQPAADLCGTVLVEDIGVPVSGTATVLERPRLCAPSPKAHKYSRGMVGIAAGAMPGAAALAASAACRIAGYTVLSGGAPAPHAIVRRSMEEMIADKRLGALLIGPGLGREDAARILVAKALDIPVPLVLDADAIMLLDCPAELANRPAPTILTPHHGEFETLFGKLPGNKIDKARAASSLSNCVIIFKGADTVIAAPDGRVCVATAASSWLASAGTGDVLAGIVAALLSSGMDALQTACTGVWLHAEAARLSGSALIADDLSARLPEALEACL
jgi:ADP-dependent NAD(P)H-hydrate dehydratase / NAD(P)H-hydrate epimerase